MTPYAFLESQNVSKKRTLTGLSRSRELSYHRKMVAKLAQKIEKPLKNAITNAMLDAIHAAENGKPLTLIQVSHRKAINNILKPAWLFCMRTFGERILNSKHTRKSLIVKSAEDNFNDYMHEYIILHGAKKVKNISDTTLQPFFDADLSNVDIAKKLRANIPAVSNYRAALIARTEMHSASNYAVSKAVKSLEFSSPIVQVWAAINDPLRTRDEHAAADGQSVGLEENFNVGGEDLEYPGDPNGSGWNTINCRCAVVHEIEN